MKRLLYWIGLLIGINSALSLLEQAEKESATYPRRNRMHYRLLQAEAMNKAYLPLDCSF